LQPPALDGTVLAMYTIARLFQVIGLTIPPLAVIAQLANPEDFKANKMLQFLLASVCIFSIGYILQRYGGGGDK
jgi:hypothetical protein